MTALRLWEIEGYPPAKLSRDTMAFLTTSGLRYHDVTVRICSISENAIFCRDAGGIERIARHEDTSWASWHIAAQNVGTWQTLKIRRWSA